MGMNHYTEYIKAITIGTWVAFCLGIGSCNLGAYNERKSHLINKSIQGEAINLEIDEPVYRTAADKIFDFLGGGFGPRLAEKRFKVGKFDKIIEKYKSRVNTQG